LLENLNVKESVTQMSTPFGCSQGRLLHWSMDATCVLKKRGGNENHAYFRENGGKKN